jgi:hypothetical protein
MCCSGTLKLCVKTVMNWNTYLVDRLSHPFSHWNNNRPRGIWLNQCVDNRKINSTKVIQQARSISGFARTSCHNKSGRKQKKWLLYFAANSFKQLSVVNSATSNASFIELLRRTAWPRHRDKEAGQLTPHWHPLIRNWVMGRSQAYAYDM